MNEIVNLIPICIVYSKKSYSRMILLSSEKQCIYMYRGRGRRAGGGGAAEKEEEVYLDVIMTNTDIFHIFHITSLFNLRFLPYFSYLFTIQLTFPPYFPFLFTFQFTFLLYFPNLFTIQLVFFS